MSSIIEPNYQIQFIEYCEEGKLEEIKQLLSEHQTNINIHYASEKAFYLACKNGRLEVVKYLLSLDPTIYRKINIHEWEEFAFGLACENGHIEVVKYLLSLDHTIYGKINIHAYSEYVFRYTCKNGHIEIVKYLLSLDHNIYGQINIYIKDDYALHNACKHGRLEVVIYLCEICEDYSYEIINNKIIPIIKRFDISDLQIVDVKEKVQCLICGCEETNDIINLNCKNGLLHCYCVSCFEEIYKKYHKCSYCMQLIDKTNIYKVNIISSE